MMSSKRKWFFYALILVALISGGIFYVQSLNSVEGWYVVRDKFLDTNARETVSILFVEVPEYDSTKMEQVAELESELWLEGNEPMMNRDRTLLLHFFAISDTGTLTEEMIDELAYTNPSLQSPESLLRVVPNGWVAKADYPPNENKPKRFVLVQSQFYMPQPGVKAADLRSK